MTMLTPERWQRMENLFEQALGWPPAEREQRLLRTCSDDGELYRQVLELLGRHGQLEGFLGNVPVPLLEFV